jgi:long-subunit acyl-CoA synthetase (AMP-forming)
MLGAIPFSIYNTSAPEQIAGLLADSGARVIITGAGVCTGRVRRRGAGGPDVRNRPPRSWRRNIALLVLDTEVLAMLAPGATLASAHDDPRVRAAVHQTIDAANLRLNRAEQIKRFHVLNTDWLPDSDELTPTMKLKRRVISEKHAGEIERLYS